MGLLDGLLGGGLQAQAPGTGLAPSGGGFMDRLSHLQQTNPDAFIALGAGLMRGDMAGGVRQMGASMRNFQEREQDASLQREGWDRQDARFDKTFGLQQRQLNQTLKWAASTGDPDVIGLAGAGMFDEAFKVWNAKSGPGGGAKYGVSPVYGVDANGNTIIGQLGKDGSFNVPQMPEGVQPLSPYGVNEQKARGSAVGKAMGEAQSELPATIQKAENMLATIEDIESDPYRERGTGASSVFNAIPATGGYDFAQKVKQLQGQSFLEAFESLKGGGQITEVEGIKAEQAIARLSTAQSEDAFMVALQDLKEVVAAGVSRARQRAGQAPVAERPANPGAKVIGGYTIEAVD